MTTNESANRHPELAALLERVTPVAVHEMAWAGGAMPLRVRAFTTPARLPMELISSIRCIVGVGDRIVFCANEDGAHPWPGGRRLPGESITQTAVREVHEETGWLLDPGSLVPLGWLMLTHLAPPRPGIAGPYPDFLQVVFTGTAAERDGGVDVQWTDTDGYELSSRLVTLDEAMRETSTDLLAPEFLKLMGATASRRTDGEP